MAHQRIETFTGSGTFTATVSGVHKFKTIGTGGGGKKGTGGGGGGASATKSVFMSKDDTAVIVIGTGAVDTDGADTTVTISSVVVCKAVGGKSCSNGGSGGLASDCIGDSAFNGGDGTQGASNRIGGGGGGTIENAPGGFTGGNFFGGGAGSGVDAIRFYGAGGSSSNSAQYPGTSGVCMVSYEVIVPDFPVIVNRAYTRIVGTANAITLPSGSVGDLILVLISSDSTSALTYTTTGWTKAEQANSGTETVRGLVVYKVATGSDSLTVDVSASENLTAIAYRIKNFAPTDFIGIASVGGGSTNPDSPNLDMTDENNYLWISAVMRDLNATGVNRVSAPPMNYMDFEYLSPSTPTSGADIAVATRHLAASSENPGAFTADSEQWAAFTIAIKYAAQETKTRHRVTII